jgi:hypothetical protein
LLRALILIGLLLAAAVWLEPTVHPEKRSVLLRLRTTEEIQQAVRAGSRTLGGRVVGAIRSQRTPPVGAGPGKASRPEQLTERDQERLDRLIDRVTRDP